MSILLPGTEIVVHNELYSCIITGLIEHLLKNKKWKTMVIISQKGRFFFFSFQVPYVSSASTRFLLLGIRMHLSAY